MSDRAANPKQRSNAVLIVLIVLFLSPIALSWYLYNFTEFGSNDESHGNLLVSKILQDVTLFDPAKGTYDNNLHGKWTLLYLLEGNCDKGCKEDLLTMQQLHHAMGREAHRVQRVLLIIDYEHSVLSFTQYEDQLILSVAAHESEKTLDAFKLNALDSPANAGRLYLIDPLGNLMLYYPAGTNPAGIIEDLKRLLKYSRIG